MNPDTYATTNGIDGQEMRPAMNGVTSKLKLIVDSVDVAEFYDANGELDASCATREIFLTVGALATMIVVDDLYAIPLAVDDTEIMISLINRYRWTAHERVTPPDPWRRWPTDHLAAFIIHSMAKVVPPFWWTVDAGDALTVAAGVIDEHRHETGLVESSIRELVDSVRVRVRIGSGDC